MDVDMYYHVRCHLNLYRFSHCLLLQRNEFVAIFNWFFSRRVDSSSTEYRGNSLPARLIKYFHSLKSKNHLKCGELIQKLLQKLRPSKKIWIFFFGFFFLDFFPFLLHKKKSRFSFGYFCPQRKMENNNNENPDVVKMEKNIQKQPENNPEKDPKKKIRIFFTFF